MKIVDMHCDTISRLLERKRAGRPEGLSENSGHLDLARMRKSGYLLQNFALFVDMGKSGEPWREACDLCALYEEQMASCQEQIAPVYRFADIAAAEAAGKMCALLTVEEGGVCGGALGRLRELYERGVRMMTLTWNYPNELGSPAKAAGGMSRREGGLTETGRVFVAQMERLGMIVDVSHLSDAGFYDVAQLAGRPFVASHSNARAVCGHPRNMTDDMIRKTAEAGGCIGLNFYRDFLTRDPEESALGALARHAAHLFRTGGEEVVGLGSDFDGIDTNGELPGTQSVGLVWEALHAAGFTQRQLDGIFYRNVLRVYREILG